MLAGMRKNLAIKLTSLALAGLLWAMVAGQRVVVRQLDVPLDMPELPDSLIYLEPPPEKIQVTLSTSGRRLFWLRLKPPRMQPSFTPRAGDDLVRLRLRESFLELPRQFDGKVLEIHPAQLDVQVVVVVTKEVPVKVVVGKEPRHPFRFAEGSVPTAEPARVLARGPRERVNRMPWVRTEFLDLSDATAGGTREVALDATDSLISFSPARVRVDYEIEAWKPE